MDLVVKLLDHVLGSEVTRVTSQGPVHESGMAAIRTTVVVGLSMWVAFQELLCNILRYR